MVFNVRDSREQPPDTNAPIGIGGHDLPEGVGKRPRRGERQHNDANDEALLPGDRCAAVAFGLGVSSASSALSASASALAFSAARSTRRATIHVQGPIILFTFQLGCWPSSGDGWAMCGLRQCLLESGDSQDSEPSSCPSVRNCYYRASSTRARIQDRLDRKRPPAGRCGPALRRFEGKGGPDARSRKRRLGRRGTREGRGGSRFSEKTGRFSTAAALRAGFDALNRMGGISACRPPVPRCLMSRGGASASTARASKSCRRSAPLC
jgi:hypothetical protein